MSRMIEVVDYDPVWIAAFEKEAATLNAVSGSFYTSILRHDLKPSHFGLKVFHVVSGGVLSKFAVPTTNLSSASCVREFQTSAIESLYPVEGTGDGLFPFSEETFTSLCVHERFPGPIDAPLFLEFDEVFVEAHG